MMTRPKRTAAKIPTSGSATAMDAGPHVPKTMTSIAMRGTPSCSGELLRKAAVQVLRDQLRGTAAEYTVDGNRPTTTKTDAGAGRRSRHHVVRPQLC